jgi:hypothetical protein
MEPSYIFITKYYKVSNRELINSSSVLLEKLTIVQPLKKYPAFYGNGRFFTMFNKASHSFPTLGHIQPVLNLPPYFFKIQITISEPG